MSQFIDRRLNGKNKSMVNRQRFIHRFKKQIKEAVSNAIAGRSIKDMDSGEKISIPAKDITEPHFQHASGGKRHIVHPGNQDFMQGDKVKRPEGGDGQGGGSQASDSGEGSDDFGFEISKEEFLDLFFEDLELPNLIKTRLDQQIESFKWVRAGYTPHGTHANINVLRSLRGSIARRRAMGSSYRRHIHECEEAIAKLLETTTEEDDRVVALRKDIVRLQKSLKSIPFIDTFDLRFNNRIKQPTPTTKAVIFCLMDVSGSMDEAKKDIAKRFFILLYLTAKKKLK